jgi:formate hydrogenlyase transcriptional activator
VPLIKRVEARVSDESDNEQYGEVGVVSFSKSISDNLGPSPRRVDRLIGNSPALNAALRQVDLVAPTGSIAQRIGRFELADHGTLFLDEVGDIPLSLQPKLLRVLQEQEFERLGSTKTQQMDVRLVAATNRDLAEMVRNGNFRSDLYYRLNVFPILLPPLRARREDIPLLVTYFVDLFCHRIGRQIDHIPLETMSALCSYDWPGNIRELQNMIERAVILCSDFVLPNPLLGQVAQDSSDGSPNLTRLKEVERAIIVGTLQDRGWTVGGSEGAAAQLGMKRTTLIAKMQRYGIFRPVSESMDVAIRCAEEV